MAAGRSEATVQARVYCIVPQDLAPALHDLLRRHFRDRADVEVIVERRADDRRARIERRGEPARELAEGRRRILAVAGRRVAERRVTEVAVGAFALPRRAQRHADRIVFIERLEPSAQALEDADTARLVARIQAGDRGAFASLYMRYFDRVYGYLRLALNDPHEAEDAAQEIFIRVLSALPRYERRAQPFRAWLFVIARNHAMTRLKRSGAIEPAEPAVVDRVREEHEIADLPELEWISNRELLMFIERLPLIQRQVLVLRYTLDFSLRDAAGILGRSPNEISAFQHRALRTLRERLSAIGWGGVQRRRVPSSRWVRPARVLRRRRFALTP
jgi:RNA polymerase sigma-70 factor (ECF subfamily)